MNQIKPLPKNLLVPKSLAIVGASRSPHKVGFQLVQNILASGYSGQIYLINPNAQKILGYRVYPSLANLPHVPDLALIATPAPLVIPIAQQAADLGVKLAVIISAGFAESGTKGQELQLELHRAVNYSPLRVLGPNCLGLVNPYHHLNAAFGPQAVAKGNLFLISQSGALITSIFDYAKQRSLGFSQAVSLGNRLDINETDLLSLAYHDPHTQVIAVYLESFANAPDFFKLASQVVHHKPIVFLKGGSSSVGAKASASHTGALATPSALVSALCRQAGVLEFETIESWLAACQLLCLWPQGFGPNVGIVSNAGGPGVLTTDFGSKLGFRFPPFSPKSHQALMALGLPAINNPLDVLGDASPEIYSKALAIASTDSGFDALYGLITPQTMTQPVKIATKFMEIFKANHKPMAVSFIGGSIMANAKKLTLNSGLPTFDFPNDGLKAFETGIQYHQIRQEKSPFSSYTPTKTSDLPLPKASLMAYFSILKKYGFKPPRFQIITKLEDIPTALDYVGRPAMLKTADPHLAHKAVLGGVIPDIMTASHARIAFRRLQKLYPQVLFQQTMVAHLELILGAKRDPQLGPFIILGLGGSYTDILADRAYFFLPASQAACIRLFSATKAYSLLMKLGLDLDPVLQAVNQLSSLILDNPSIQEIEINPLLVAPRQVYPVDIKLTF